MITIQMNDVVFYAGVVTPAVTIVFFSSLFVLGKLIDNLPGMYKTLVHQLGHVAFLRAQVRLDLHKIIRRIDLNTNIGKQLIVYDKVRRWCSVNDSGAIIPSIRVITCTVPATRDSPAEWFYEDGKAYDLDAEEAKHHERYIITDNRGPK